MFYLNIDKDGTLLSVSLTDTGGPCIDSLEGLDLSGYRIGAYRWDGEELVLDEDKLAVLAAEDAERAAAEAQTSLLDQLRADIDFIAAMQGVIL